DPLIEGSAIDVEPEAEIGALQQVEVDPRRIENLSVNRRLGEDVAAKGADFLSILDRVECVNLDVDILEAAVEGFLCADRRPAGARGLQLLGVASLRIGEDVDDGRLVARPKPQAFVDDLLFRHRMQTGELLALLDLGLGPKALFGFFDIERRDRVEMDLPL